MCSLYPCATWLSLVSFSSLKVFLVSREFLTQLVILAKYLSILDKARVPCLKPLQGSGGERNRSVWNISKSPQFLVASFLTLLWSWVFCPRHSFVQIHGNGWSESFVVDDDDDSQLLFSTTILGSCKEELQMEIQTSCKQHQPARRETWW